MRLVAGRTGHLAYLIVAVAGETACSLVVDLERGCKGACFPLVEQDGCFECDVAAEAGTALRALR